MIEPSQISVRSQSWGKKIGDPLRDTASRVGNFHKEIKKEKREKVLVDRD